MNELIGKLLQIYLKGIFIGIANIVPGLSGGTIALILGIYDRLLSCISEFNLSLFSNMARSWDPSYRGQFKFSINKLDLPFLIPISFGILTAIVLLSNFISFSFTHFRAFSNSFFLGILVMSLILLSSEINLDSIPRLLYVVFAFTISFILSGSVSSIQTSPGSAYIFISGMLVSLAMLLPGISGAALLYLLGFYEFLLATFNEFLLSLPSLMVGNYHSILQPGLTLSVFGLGFLIGLVNSAKFVKMALNKNRETTMSILLALMVGSFRFPISEIINNTQSSNFESILLVLFFFFIGAFAPYLLSKVYGPST
tara:strand:+ start:10768 stop:11703 length:936 start_codon:yes stop_codon:yes gene_type:complete